MWDSSFQGVGWAGLHSDLADPDNDTFFLFKSSPYGSVSHSRADQNAFAITKGGHALAIPSGHYAPSYGMPHHSEWTRSTKASNCVLVVTGKDEEIDAKVEEREGWFGCRATWEGGAAEGWVNLGSEDAAKVKGVDRDGATVER